MDVLRFPSCKLYQNGRFRLPNRIKADFVKKHFRRVVIIAISENRCMIVPVSIWEKKLFGCNVIQELKYPRYPQSLRKTFLLLHQRLVEHLQQPAELFLEFQDNYCLIHNDEQYNEKNRLREIQIRDIYENL